MAWDDDGIGKLNRVYEAGSSKAGVFWYRAVVALTSAVSATLMSIMFSGYVDLVKNAAVIKASLPETDRRLTKIEDTIGGHTSQIQQSQWQESSDTVYLKTQIDQIVKKLDETHTESSEKFSGLSDQLTKQKTALDAAQAQLNAQGQELTSLNQAIKRGR